MKPLYAFFHTVTLLNIMRLSTTAVYSVRDDQHWEMVCDTTWLNVTFDDRVEMSHWLPNIERIGKDAGLSSSPQHNN